MVYVYETDEYGFKKSYEVSTDNLYKAIKNNKNSRQIFDDFDINNIKSVSLTPAGFTLESKSDWKIKNYKF